MIEAVAWPCAMAHDPDAGAYQRTRMDVPSGLKTTPYLDASLGLAWFPCQMLTWTLPGMTLQARNER